MKAFIGQYFKTLEEAIKAYEEMGKYEKKAKSVCELKGNYFIVGNSTIEEFNIVRKK